MIEGLNPLSDEYIELYNDVEWIVLFMDGHVTHGLYDAEILKEMMYYKVCVGHDVF